MSAGMRTSVVCQFNFENEVLNTSWAHLNSKYIEVAQKCHEISFY